MSADAMGTWAIVLCVAGASLISFAVGLGIGRLSRGLDEMD